MKEEEILVSVVMPCLNEAETLPHCIAMAMEGLTMLGKAGEIVVADNGSHDRSVEIAEALGARVVHVPEKGYGNALRQGILVSRGTYIVMGDCDCSYDFRDCKRFVDTLESGFDLVMGCRLPNGGGRIKPGAMPWLHRWIGNPALSFIGRLFFGAHISDFHCGLRAFRKEAFITMDTKTTGMEFASEMVIKAVLHNLRISEIPITLHKDRRSRPPHLRCWRDGWRHLRFMLLYCPTWLFLFPGFMLCTLAVLFGIPLIMAPLRFFQLGLDTNTLLVCAASLLVGIQLIMFGVFTRVFTYTEGLVPPTGKMKIFEKLLSLERGLVVGGGILLCGILCLFRALMIWCDAGFGVIPYSDSLRLVIPAVTFIMLAIQIIFFSFFLNILNLPRTS